MLKFPVKKNTEIEIIFNESQTNNLHDLLIQKLIRIHNKSDSDDFVYEFITCLKTLFSTTVDGNSVDKVLEFVAQFVIDLVGLNAEDNSDVSEKSQHFFYSLFEFFLKYHDAPSPNVRKKICQFISKLMRMMNPNAMLDCNICEIITKIMLERIKDKVPVIRMQAVHAIFRLQDGSDVACPVVKGILYLLSYLDHHYYQTTSTALVNCMETDTSADVRRLALCKVLRSHKYLIQKLVDRADDLSERVRIEVYAVLSNLDIRQFSIEQRKRLLNTGLNDNNESVRNAVKNKLLPAWLKRLKYNYLDFLKALDLNVNSIEMATKALMSLFHNSANENAIATLNPIMCDTKTIPFEKLTSQSAFFWKNYVFFMSNLVSETNNYRWDYGKSYDAAADGLLPDLSVFCAYIEGYCKLTNGKFDKQPWEKKEEEFILIQLIELCKTYDYGDEVGRKKLESLCLELLKYIEMETIRPVVELYFMLRTNLNESISKITEVMNDLLHPFPEIVENNVDLAEEQNINSKITQLRGVMNNYEDLLNNAVEVEDYVGAQKLKDDISKVKDEIQELEATLMASRINSIDVIEENMNDQDKEKDPDDILEIFDSTTIQRCLTMLQEMLHFSFVKQLTPELRILLQTLVLPVCESGRCSVAPLAIEVLGSCCLRDVTLAKDYFFRVFRLCCEEDICVTALKVVFDLLLCFGPNEFDIYDLADHEKYKNSKSKSKKPKPCCYDSSDESSSENSDEKEQPPEINRPPGFISGFDFIEYLVNLLDDEADDARFIVVHGICQLMATGKLKSYNVLSRLILIWFHPASKKSLEINDCLNYFFPLYVKNCSWALSLFEKAIVKTMDTLFNAPVNNPLFLVDQNGVLKTLCDLTNPNFMSEKSEVGENIHFNVAVLLCNRIMNLDDPKNQAVLLKGLDHLDLSSTDSSILPTLENLINKVINKFKEENEKKLVAKARASLLRIRSLHSNREKMPSIRNTICSERSEDDLDVDEMNE